MCGSCRRGRSRGEGVGCELFFFDCAASEIVGIVSHDLLCSAPEWTPGTRPPTRTNGSSARAAEREVTGVAERAFREPSRRVEVELIENRAIEPGCVLCEV
jgi:hypothetical protein